MRKRPLRPIRNLLTFLVGLGVAAILAGCSAPPVNVSTAPVSNAQSTPASAAPSIGNSNYQDVCAEAQKLITTDPNSAISLIESLRNDSEPAGAEPRVVPQDACAHELVNARLATAEPAKDPTLVQQWSASWSDFTAHWLMPLQSPGWAMLLVVVSALVLARCLAFLPLMWRGQTSQRNAGHSKAVGLLLIFVGALLIFWGSLAVVVPTAPRGSVQLMEFAGASLFVVGIVAFARGLATDRKISVQVRDRHGAPAATHTSNVMAHLSRLGGEEPQGMNFAIGSDLDFLSDSPLIGEAANKSVGRAPNGSEIRLRERPLASFRRYRG